MQRSTTAALAVALALVTPSLHAQSTAVQATEPAPPSWSVQWNAPRSCPTQRQVLARVRAQVGDNVVRPTSVQVTVSERGDEWIASVRIGDSDVRDVRADSCDRAASAAAVVIGVALAPEPSPATTSAPDVTPIPTSSAAAPRPSYEPFSITRRYPTRARIAIFEESISENDAQWNAQRAAEIAGSFTVVGTAALLSGVLFASPTITTDRVRLGAAISMSATTAVTLGISLWGISRAATSPYATFADTLHSSLERGESSEVALERAEQSWRRAAQDARDARNRGSIIAIVGGAIIAASGAAYSVFQATESAPNLPPVPWTGIAAIAGGALYVGIGAASQFLQSPIESSFSRYQRRSRLSVWPLIIPLTNGAGGGIAGTF